MKLHLTLTKKWFDMIASGEKKEEYREVKEYWIKRLMEEPEKFGRRDDKFKKFESVMLKNGYAVDAPEMEFEVKKIERGRGRHKWGAGKGGIYFVISLGKRLS